MSGQFELQFAHIVPTMYLPSTAFSNYHMALAHIAMRDGEYRQFYRKRALEYSEHILLDNGAFEDSQVAIPELIRLVTKMHATELILPDILGDCSGTLKATEEALMSLTDSIYQPRIQLMAVAQGDTWSDWVLCAKTLIRMSSITCIGIPKLLIDQFGEDARLNAVGAIADDLEDIEVHLLGCGTDPWEPYRVHQKFPTIVRGVDSSIAYVYTLAGKRVGCGARPNKSIDFNHPPKDVNIGLLESNMRVWEEGPNCE